MGYKELGFDSQMCSSVRFISELSIREMKWNKLLCGNEDIWNEKLINSVWHDTKTGAHKNKRSYKTQK